MKKIRKQARSSCRRVWEWWRVEEGQSINGKKKKNKGLSFWIPRAQRNPSKSSSLCCASLHHIKWWVTFLCYPEDPQQRFSSFWIMSSVKSHPLPLEKILSFWSKPSPHQFNPMIYSFLMTWGNVHTAVSTTAQVCASHIGEQVGKVKQRDWEYRTREPSCLYL